MCVYVRIYIYIYIYIYVCVYVYVCSIPPSSPSCPLQTMRSLLTLPLLWAAGAAADFVSVSTFNELKSKVQACDGTTLELRITSDIIVTEKLILSNACALTLSGVNSASGKVALDGAGKTGILMAMGGANLVAENIRFINGYDYVCDLYIYIYIYMHIYMCVYTYALTYARTNKHTHPHTCIHMHTNMNTHTLTHHATLSAPYILYLCVMRV